MGADARSVLKRMNPKKDSGGSMSDQLVNEISELLPNVPKQGLKAVFEVLTDKGIDADKIDWMAMGKDIDLDVLKGFLFQEYGIEITAPKSATETATKTATSVYSDIALWKPIVSSTLKCIALIGGGESGKTALAYRIMREYKNAGHEVYTLRHPRPELVKKLNWKNLTSLQDLTYLNGGVVWLDEPQLLFPIGEKKGNSLLARILSIARHRNLTIIISTNMTQWISRTLEGQIDVWVVKDLDYKTLKQGSYANKIIKDFSSLDPEGFRLKVEEYLLYCRKFPELGGKHTFVKPKFFTEDYSKPYGGEQ